MCFDLFRRRKGKNKVPDVEAQCPSAPSAYCSSYSPRKVSSRPSAAYSNYGASWLPSPYSSNYGASSSSMRYGASTDQNPYSHYGGGYSNGYHNNNPAVHEYHDHYYMPAPQPSPPLNQQPQEPWSPEFYIPPSPMNYQMEPPPQPSVPPYHFFEPPPQRSSVHRSVK